MTGHAYTQLIASYIVDNFAERGIEVYREVAVGKSIIGKNRRVDLLLLDQARGAAFAVECKYQDSQGTADEKIPYALDDLASLQMAGCLVYAGGGFSTGVQHMLQSSELAAYCLPDPADLASRPAQHVGDRLAVEPRIDLLDPEFHAAGSREDHELLFGLFMPLGPRRAQHERCLQQIVVAAVGA